MFGLLLGSIMQFLVASPFGPVISPLASPLVNGQVMAQHAMSLDKRYQDAFVNKVFKENILLTLAYGRNLVTAGQPVNWSMVNQPFHWELTLLPGQVLTYHDTILPKYQAEAIPLTTVHFNSAEGFLSDGYLVGDGTCHLASLLAWVAKDAKLAVEAPTNHDFAVIPEVPKENGVSIYSQPQNKTASALQNLYIQNNQDHPVRFAFDYDGSVLRVSTLKFL